MLNLPCSSEGVVPAGVFSLYARLFGFELPPEEIINLQNSGNLPLLLNLGEINRLMQEGSGCWLYNYQVRLVGDLYAISHIVVRARTQPNPLVVMDFLVRNKFPHATINGTCYIKRSDLHNLQEQMASGSHYPKEG